MSQLNSSNYPKTLCAKLFFGPNNGKIDFREIQHFIQESNLQHILNASQMSDYILLLFLVIFGFSDLLLYDNINPLYPYNTIDQLKTISFLDQKYKDKWNQIPYTYRHILFLSIFSSMEADKPLPPGEDDPLLLGGAAASSPPPGPLPPQPPPLTPSPRPPPTTQTREAKQKAKEALESFAQTHQAKQAEKKKRLSQWKKDREQEQNKELEGLSKSRENKDNLLEDFLKQYEYKGNLSEAEWEEKYPQVPYVKGDDAYLDKTEWKEKYPEIS